MDLWRCLHPILLAMYPALLLYSENRQALGLVVLVTPFVLSALLGLAFLLLSLVFGLNKDKAALSASGLVFFFSFGWLWLALDNMTATPIPRLPLLVIY